MCARGNCPSPPFFRVSLNGFSHASGRGSLLRPQAKRMKPELQKGRKEGGRESMRQGEHTACTIHTAPPEKGPRTPSKTWPHLVHPPPSPTAPQERRGKGKGTGKARSEGQRLGRWRLKRYLVGCVLLQQLQAHVGIPTSQGLQLYTPTPPLPC